MIPVNLFPDVFPDLNVADIDVVTGAAGPGRRLVIWLQGCLKRCAGCANGPFLPAKRASVLSWRELAAAVNNVDGVTLSGGDPVLQASALLPLLAEIRNRDRTVVCYTGYTIEELRAEGGLVVEFLDQIDVLIDGEYQSLLPRAGMYRPTANQRLHFLSGRISESALHLAPETVVRIGGGEVTSTGTLPAVVAREMSERLAPLGIVLRPRRIDVR